MNIIGVLGQAGAGKDTFADYLVKNNGYVRIALADEMKRIAKRLYGFSDSQLWGPSAERNKPDLRWPRKDGTFLSPREALQLMGTEFGRRAHPDTWISITLEIAEQVMEVPYDYEVAAVSYSAANGIKENTLYNIKPANGVVISDCRFKNEVGAIKAAGGKVVRLKRQGLNSDFGIAGHQSEEEQKSLPDFMFDIVIDVPEGIPAFHAKIQELINSGKL